MTMTLERPQPSIQSEMADDPRWVRIVARDKTADGCFWYSVATTGIYCRPSCPSRTANPRNVQLHDTLAAAQGTGFPPVQTLQPGRNFDRGKKCSDHRAGLPPDRGERGRAILERSRRGGRTEPHLLSSHVQGRHGADAEGLCRCASCGEGPPRPGLG